MIRMRVDTDILSTNVKPDVCKDQTENISLLDMGGSYVQQVVPFEVKITKAKEGKKNIAKFHLFSGTNLKIYDTLSEFYMDLPVYKASSAALKNQIDLLGHTVQQIGQLDQQNGFELNLL